MPQENGFGRSSSAGARTLPLRGNAVRQSEWSRLREWLLRERAERAQDLAVGKPRTLDAYREAVGYIAALDAIESFMSKLTGGNNSEGEDL